MEYPKWEMPFDGPINELSSRQLRTYRGWFEGQIDGRLAILDGAISQSEGFEYWAGSSGPDDLPVVSRWLSVRVLDLWKEGDDPPNELTSIGWDVGLHIGRVLVVNLGWRWEQYLASRRMVDYGHMVVRGQTGVYRNTLRQANVIVRRLHRGAWTPDEMRMLYVYAEAESNGQLHSDLVAKF